VSACAEDALDAPVFNPAGDERTGTRFWLTTVLNETVIHGFDTANAADRPADIHADIAAALISNHLAMLTSPTWAMQRPESAHAIAGTGQTLQWQATDTADDTDAWCLERQPDGATWRHGTAPADVTVTGPARSLLLTLTRRLPLTDRRATGISIDATPTSPGTGSPTPPTSAADRLPRQLPTARPSPRGSARRTTRRPSRRRRR
jgi:hypothetical protein